MIVVGLIYAKIEKEVLNNKTSFYKIIYYEINKDEKNIFRINNYIAAL